MFRRLIELDVIGQNFIGRLILIKNEVETMGFSRVLDVGKRHFWIFIRVRFNFKFFVDIVIVD